MMSLEDLNNNFNNNDFSENGIPVEFLPEEYKYTILGFDYLKNTGFFIAGQDYESKEEARGVMNAKVKSSREINERVEYHIINHRGISIESKKSYDE